MTTTVDQDVANMRRVLPETVKAIEAAEHRATVERIREQLSKRVYVAGTLGLGFVGRKKWEAIVAILDEEAAR